MSILIRFCYAVFLMVIVSFSHAVFADDTINIPILCYHNFNPTMKNSMTITPERFESQLKWLKDNGFTVIPLKEAVAYLQGKRATVPAKSVVITVDDGWKSAYTYLYPIVKKYNIPVTLFIFPEPISKGKNNLTWKELKELQQTGLFDIQGHTYWHPNFKQEKRKHSPAAYAKLVKSQLEESKKIIEDNLGTKVTLLAWPFGIYDKYLEEAAAKAGYEMAFSIDYKTANRNFRPMAQPRFMIVVGQTMKTFVAIVNGANHKSEIKNAQKN